MKNFFLKLILIGGLSYIGLLFAPWWWIVLVVAIVVNLILKSRGAIVFLSSFFGCSLVWFIQSFLIYQNVNKVYVNAFAGMFSPFFADKGLFFIITTSLVIGLVAALAGYTANALRNIVIKPKKDYKAKYGKPDYSRYR